MANIRIRTELKEKNVKQYELARLMGIGETTLCRRLRYELPTEEQDRIVELIFKEASSKEGWYSWYPEDDWFCANGERKDT